MFKFFLVFIFVFFFPATTHAEEWIFGGNGGYVMSPQPITKNTLLWGNTGSGPGGESTITQGNGWNLIASASVFRSVVRHVYIGLDADWYTEALTMKGNANNCTCGPFSNFYGGNTVSVGIFPSVLLMTDPLDSVTFYGAFGVGLVLNYVNTSSGWNWNCSPRVGCAGEGFGNSMGLRVGTGFDWWITDHFALNTEVGFIYNPTNITNTVAGIRETPQSANLSVFFIEFGFRFRF